MDYNTLGAKGDYDTDFSNIRNGNDFPSNEVKRRNRNYRYNMRLFTGEYGKDKNLIAMIDDQYQEIDYKVLSINYFELIVNKLMSLIFGNELTYTVGDIEKDKEVKKLVEKTKWLKSVMKAGKLCAIYGDCCMKTYRTGVSAFAPLYAYKVLDESNKDLVKAYVLYELLYDKQDNKARHIRILISGKGFEYERIYEYSGTYAGGKLGKPVRYKYKNRWIPKKGRYYWTGIEDAETVQWLSFNTEKDGVYGSSSFESIKDLVFAIENRISTENWVIDAHGKPLLLVGMSSMKTNEQTGEHYLSVINGKYMVSRGGEDNKPEYLTWDGKLDASKELRDDLMGIFYELSEMGKTFLSGEYKGNISEESLNNIIKSAIDRANREVNDIWHELRSSLYVLCRLNNIDVKLEDINITFNVGRADDDTVLANICDKLIETKMFSRKTLLSKYWGYNENDADAEFERIRIEEGGEQ